MQKRFSLYLVTLLLCLSLFFREGMPHGNCIWCRPTFYPHQLAPTFYEMDGIQSDVRYNAGSYIGFAGKCKKTVSDPYSLFVAVWKKSSREYIHPDDGFEVVPFSDPNLFQGIHDVTANERGENWMVWLETSSTTHHYFTMFSFSLAQTTSTFRFPVETGFTYKMVEQKSTYDSRWYIMTSNGVDKVYIYKMQNLFDKAAIVFQERLEITYPDATEINMGFRLSQAINPSPAEDRFMVAGYQLTSSGARETLWTSVSDTYYALQDAPTIDFNYVKPWDPGQSPAGLVFNEYSMKWGSSYYYADFHLQWVTDGIPNQLSMMVFRCERFNELSCVHTEVAEEGETDLRYFYDFKYSIEFSQADRILEWKLQTGSCTFDDQTVPITPDHCVQAMTMITESTSKDEKWILTHTIKTHIPDDRIMFDNVNAVKFTGTTKLYFVVGGAGNPFYMAREMTFGTIEDAEWLQYLDANPSTAHTADGPLYMHYPYDGWCHRHDTFVSQQNNGITIAWTFDDVLNDATSAAPTFVVTAGASVVDDSGNPVSFEYLTDTPSVIGASVIELGDLKYHECLPEFEARRESGAEHFWALGKDAWWVKFTNKHYKNYCREAVTTARMEPEPPSGTAANYIREETGDGCYWTIRGAPNEDAEKYTFIVDEISLAYPNDASGNPVPLKTGISTKVTLCSSDSIEDDEGQIFKIRQDAFRTEYDLKTEVFPTDVLCPYREYEMSVPYRGEIDDEILDDKRELPLPEWSTGVDFYTGIISIEGAVKNTTHTFWANGTNDAYKYTRLKRLTQPLEIYFIDCYDYETGHQLRPEEPGPFRWRYPLRGDKIEKRMDPWIFHQECTEEDIFYEATMTDNGAPVDQSFIGVYTNTHPSSLIVSIKTQKKMFIGLHKIDFTANMVLRDGGVVKQAVQFEIEIYDPDDLPPEPDVFMGFNTAPYFAVPSPNQIEVAVNTKLVLDIASLVPFDDQGQTITISYNGGIAGTFTSYDSSSEELTINPDSIGYGGREYTVALKLEDDDEDSPQSKTYSIKIKVKPADHPEGYLVINSDGSTFGTFGTGTSSGGSPTGGSGSGDFESGLSNGGSGSGTTSSSGGGGSTGAFSGVSTGDSSGSGTSSGSGSGSGTDDSGNPINPFIALLGDGDFLTSGGGGSGDGTGTGAPIDVNNIISAIIPSEIMDLFPSYSSLGDTGGASTGPGSGASTGTGNNGASDGSASGGSGSTDDSGNGSGAGGGDGSGPDGSGTSSGSGTDTENTGSGSNSGGGSDGGSGDGSGTGDGSGNGNGDGGSGGSDSGDGSGNDAGSGAGSGASGDGSGNNSNGSDGNNDGISYDPADLGFGESYTGGSSYGGDGQSNSGDGDGDGTANDGQQSQAKWTDGSSYSPFFDRKFLSKWASLTNADLIKMKAEEVTPFRMVMISNVNSEGKLYMYFNKDLIVPSVFDEDGYPRWEDEEEEDEEAVAEEGLSGDDTVDKQVKAAAGAEGDAESSQNSTSSTGNEGVKKEKTEEPEEELSAYQKSLLDQDGRLLQSNSTNSTNQTDSTKNETAEVKPPVLDINMFVNFIIYPGSDDSSFGSRLAFNTTLTRFQKRQIEVQVDYENPIEISKGSEGMDVMHVKVYDVSLFVDAQTGMPIEKYTKHTSIVHPPFASELEAVLMKVLASTTQSTMILLFFLSVLVPICLGLSLRRMWSLMNAFQILCYSFLFAQVTPPPNTYILLDYLDSAVSGRFLYDTYAWIFGIEKDAEAHTGDIEKKLELERVKLKSIHLGDNLTGYLVVGIMIAVLVGIFFATRLCIKKSPRLKRYREILKKMMMVNLFLRFMLQTDLKMLHMAIAYFSLDAAFRTGGLSFLLALVIIAYLVFPLFVFVIVMHLHYMELLKTKNMEGKFGTVWLGLRSDERLPLTYYVVFCLRRLFLVVLLTQFYYVPWFQIQALIMSHVFYLIYVGQTEPHKSKSDMILDLTNEFMLILASYHLLVFSAFVPDPYARHTMGWTLLAIIILMVIINIYFLLQPLSVMLRAKWRQAKLQKISFFSLICQPSKDMQEIARLYKEPDEDEDGEQQEQLSQLRSLVTLRNLHAENQEEESKNNRKPSTFQLIMNAFNVDQDKVIEEVSEESSGSEESKSNQLSNSVSDSDRGKAVTPVTPTLLLSPLPLGSLSGQRSPSGVRSPIGNSSFKLRTMRDDLSDELNDEVADITPSKGLSPSANTNPQGGEYNRNAPKSKSSFMDSINAGMRSRLEESKKDLLYNKASPSIDPIVGSQLSSRHLKRTTTMMPERRLSTIILVPNPSKNTLIESTPDGTPRATPSGSQMNVLTQLTPKARTMTRDVNNFQSAMNVLPGSPMLPREGRKGGLKQRLTSDLEEQEKTTKRLKSTFKHPIDYLDQDIKEEDSEIKMSEISEISDDSPNARKRKGPEITMSAFGSKKSSVQFGIKPHFSGRDDKSSPGASPKKNASAFGNILTDKLAKGIRQQRLTTFSVGMGLLNQPSDARSPSRNITTLNLTEAAHGLRQSPSRKAQTSIKVNSPSPSSRKSSRFF